MKINLKKLQTSLLDWYLQNNRTLPWRQYRDPYRIWISEVMLQQTTSTAVIPFYEKFLQRFPDLQALATTELKEVLPYWAGLGYYSRIRNLHKAAQLIYQLGAFPQTFESLLKLPGFGPYTARAVSSIAFNEPVGVVDGNVIRILSRVSGTAFEWWKTDARNQLQEFSDQLVSNHEASQINQAMMDLGAMICTPSSPSCLLCPWARSCKALAQKTVTQLPLKKLSKEKEFWLWNLNLLISKDEKMALTQSHSLPFLKKVLLPPGSAEKVKTKPKEYDFQHSITHHQIFVKVHYKKKISKVNSDYLWHPVESIKEVNPSSLIQKTLNTIKEEF